MDVDTEPWQVEEEEQEGGGGEGGGVEDAHEIEEDGEGEVWTDVPQNINTTTGAKFSDISRSWNTQVGKLFDQGSNLLTMFTHKHWKDFFKSKWGDKPPNCKMKSPMPAGVFMITVSPTGTAQIRISSGLSQMPIFDKYAKQLMWALKVALDDYARDLSKADIGGDHGEAPPEFLFKEINPEKKSARGRADKPQDADLWKIAAREVMKQLKESNDPHDLTRFCPREKRFACRVVDGQLHDGGVCGDKRAAFPGYPDDLPCVEPSHWSKTEHKQFVGHYAATFPDIVVPTAPPPKAPK